MDIHYLLCISIHTSTASDALAKDSFDDIKVTSEDTQYWIIKMAPQGLAILLGAGPATGAGMYPMRSIYPNICLVSTAIL